MQLQNLPPTNAMFSAPYTAAAAADAATTAAVTTPSTADFHLAVTRVMQGVDPATAAAAAAAAAATTNSRSGTTSSHTSIAPTPPTVSIPGMLDASAFASGPASRRRGIEYARRVKDNAREEFKEKRRRELEANGEGERIKRRKKNDTSMSEDQKYRRRLQKNQDSAAAARHASDSYLLELERQVEAYDNDMTALEQQVRRSGNERDEYAKINAFVMEQNRKLELEVQSLREALTIRTSKPVAIDEMGWKSVTPNNNEQNIASNVPPTPPAVKAIFEEYSAPTYNFPLEVGRHVRTPAAF